MKFLQIGAPHSGNFWLWSIIQRIRQRAGLANQSLVRDHAIRSVARECELIDDQKSEVDMLDVDRLGLSWRISSLFRMPIEDVDAYLAQCDHVMSHSSCCERTPAVLSKFDRVVYLVRDPRDRLLAEARAAFRPAGQKLRPHPERDPVSYIEHRFDDSLDDWRWHLQRYVNHCEAYDIHFVLYERLYYDLVGELDRLIDYLGVELDTAAVRGLCEEVGAEIEESQKGRGPGPVGGWYERFGRRHKGRAVVMCGPLLDLFDYPRYRPLDAGRLPRPPDPIHVSQFDESALLM